MYQSAKELAFKGAKKVQNFVIDNTTGVVTAVGTSLVSSQAMAEPVVLTSLTGAVDFSTVITAILAVAAIMAGVYVAWKAAKMVVAAIKTL